jgi:protein TonB
VPFAVIEDVPIFPGCENLSNNEERKQCMSQKINKFVNREFDTDLGAELGLSGVNRVIVQFKINKNGDIVEVRSRAPHPRLEKEAARVINNLPKMKPGKQRGKAVGVMYSLPIVFQVQD